MAEAVFASILIGLSAYRLWRLAALDAITEPIRVRLPNWQWVDDLVGCPHCLGSWIAFGLTWATDAIVGLGFPIFVGLSAAVIVPLVHSWLD